MHPEDLGERDGEHIAPRRPGRLILLQIVLGGEGQALQISHRPDERRLHARGLELAPVEGAVRRRVAHLLAQALRLPTGHQGARPPLDLGLEVAGGHQRCGCESVVVIAGRE